MKRKQLTKSKIGVVFGTFAPMHTGHIDLIQKAARENDQVLVVVSGDNTRDRGTKIGLHLNRRYRYVREVFRDDELIVVAKLDETNIPEYPNGWEPWLNLLDKTIKDNYQSKESEAPKITFYVGDEDYVKPLLNFFEADVKLNERSNVPISATQIRENPYKFWRYITSPFRRHFTKKVLVVGSASGGKTTLVNHLTRAYNASASYEYARVYQDLYNVTDDELDAKDYVHLFTGQYQQTAEIIDSGSHSGLIFADTNSSVTRAYVEHYLKDTISKEEYNFLDELYKTTFEREYWDLILLVMPRTTYVDDGFRDMTMSDQETRDEFTNYLLGLLEPHKDKLVILDGNPDTFFIDNYQKAKEIIKDRLNFEV